MQETLLFSVRLAVGLSVCLFEVGVSKVNNKKQIGLNTQEHTGDR